VQDLLQSATAAPSAAAAADQVQRALGQLRLAGALPLRGLGDLEQQKLQSSVAATLQAWHDAQARFPHSAQRQPLRLQIGDVVLEDWVDGLRQGPPDAQGAAPLAWLALDPGQLCEKTAKPKPRPAQLLGAWLRSLAGAACGVQATGVLVGRDSVIEISPMPQLEARQTLERLLQLWQAGMQAPLPLPPKTALAWLPLTEQPAKAQQAAQYTNARQAARVQYEGAEQVRGDVEESCMARLFPDFETLAADGQFAALAQEIYQPLLDWQKTHVRATLHPKDGADGADASDEDAP
jgi:exodeoxyribonuclease V gamma subunit